jgi:hypothetical protein
VLNRIAEKSQAVPAYFRIIVSLLTVVLLLLPVASHGEEKTAADNGREPDRYGITIEAAHVYDPGPDRNFVLISGFALYDYGKIWHQDRPKELCFKVEAAAGATTRPAVRTVASVGMLALYFLNRFAVPQIRPFVEGGIGIIYTDFRVSGQGLRVNFNPQLGLGTEFRRQDGHNLFTTLRLHHLSNGNLYHDNRGVNSIIIQVGRFF